MSELDAPTAEGAQGSDEKAQLLPLVHLPHPPEGHVRQVLRRKEEEDDEEEGVGWEEEEVRQDVRV